MNREKRRTRIIATLGPSCSTPRMIQKLVRAGMEVARLNMSHGDAAFHRTMVRLLREASRRAKKPIGIMADLQGPRVRLGQFAASLPIKLGQRLILTTRAREADPERGVLPVDYSHLPLETKAGHNLLLMDGTVRLQVDRVRGHQVICQVQEGREITPRAGLYLPQAIALKSPLTAKDRRDLALAVELEVDFLALSYVRRPKDLLDARRAIERLGGDQMLVAKIETRQAVDTLDEIIVNSDAVLVARGDLGVELLPEQVPVEQKHILRAAAAAGKPTIIATQMLESMRRSTRPTRAETSDVANAVLDGAWAVMLTAETASGAYPVETVSMMDRIIREVEPLMVRLNRRRTGHLPISVSEGLAEAGISLALDIGARGLVAMTRSGATAGQIARFPVRMDTFAYTPSPRTFQKLTLMRGATPCMLSEQPTLEMAIRKIEADLKRRGEARPGDILVFLGGAPHEPKGTTSRMAVHRVR